MDQTAIQRGLCLFFLAIALAVPFGARAAGSAILSIEIPNTTLGVGEDVTVTVIASSPDKEINAASGTIAIPSQLKVKSVSKDGSILNFWTKEPTMTDNGASVSFEGVAMSPFKGSHGVIFSITLQATKSGSATLHFTDGSLLANDGKGTNILDAMHDATVSIASSQGQQIAVTPTTKPSSPTIATTTTTKPSSGNIATVIPTSQPAPVIDNLTFTPYFTYVSSPASQSSGIALTGKGAPGATTRIEFKDITDMSPGAQFIRWLTKNRTELTQADVQNSPDGTFSYISPSNLVAGVFSAIPSLINENTQQAIAGIGTQIVVNDNTLQHLAMILINVLVLAVPIVALVLLIIFLPWYFRRRLYIMQKKVDLEAEQIEAETHKLQAEDKRLSRPQV
jgi:hypothetical protein